MTKPAWSSSSNWKSDHEKDCVVDSRYARLRIFFAQESLVKANNKFAFRIYHATRPDKDNFFVSPFSLLTGLSIVNEGLQPQRGWKWISSTGYIKNRSAVYSELIKRRWKHKDRKHMFSISWKTKFKTNFCWQFTVDTGWYAVKDSYKQVVEKDYQSNSFSFNKNHLSNANQQLNNWIIEKTSGKISGIDLSPDARMSIFNAIYFMGEWQTPVSKRENERAEFSYAFKKKSKDELPEQTIPLALLRK